MGDRFGRHVQTLRAYDPTSIGPFRLLGRLGADGIGQVYLGEGPGAQRVAVKVVHPGIAHDQRFRARFTHGVHVGAQITAPWTAGVVDADPDAAQPWLATEYVPGPSLEEAVHGAGVLPPGAVRVLAVRLAQALAGIHAAGLLHRDVTPSNVLLAADGPVLVDFGIAHAVDGTRMTATGMRAGAEFMSPEHADDAAVGPPSDVYSLGAVLVFAATGSGPAPLSPASSPAPPEAMAEPVRGLVARCLAHDPADRPTAAEIAAALGPEPAPGPQAGPAPAGAAPPPEPLPAPLPAPPVLPAHPPDPDDTAPRPLVAVPQTAPRPPDPGPPPPPPPPPPRPQAAPGGRRIRRRTLLAAAALVGVGGVGAAALLWPTGSRATVRWTYTANGDLLAVRTDGATVYAKGADSAVHAIDAGTGQPRWIFALEPAVDGDAASLAVAGTVVYASDGRSTFAIDAASGSQLWAAATGELLAADTATVLCTGLDAQRRRVVTALDPATGSPRWSRRLEDARLGASSPPDLAALSPGGAHLVGGGTLVTLDHTTGITLWSRPVTGDSVAEGIVATPDVVFVTDPTANSSRPTPVLALDVRTGRELWTVEGSTDPGFAPRLVTGDAVYSLGSTVAAAFDAATGRQRWTWSDEVERGEPLAPDNAWRLSGPTTLGDALVVLADTTPAGSHDSHQCVVIALDTRSGKSRWRVELPPSAAGSANTAFRKAGPVTTADGSVVVSVGRDLHAVTA